MQEKNMRYGQLIRAKYISNSQELTLKDIIDKLETFFEKTFA